MAEAISLPLEQDATAIEQNVYDYIQSFFPEWNPKEPQLAVIMTEALASEIADLRRMAQDISPEIFRYFGALVGIAPRPAEVASGFVNITVMNSFGYTIPESTLMRILISGDDYAAFETVSEVVIPPGQTQALGVEIISTSTGSNANNLTSKPELIDLVDYITDVSLVGSTGGGADPEDLDLYLDRLATRMQLMADRPILPRDFEIYAETAVTGVYRSLALDGYNPDDGTSNNERMITIVSLNEAGFGVNSTVKAETVATLEAVRELTFQVNTMDPTTTAVTVTATVVLYPGYDPATVAAVAEAAVADYLNPANWGKPRGQSGEMEKRWIKQTKVRYGELYAILNYVEGVNYVEGPIVINGASNTDLTLAGVAPLPASNPTVTVTAQLPT